MTLIRAIEKADWEAVGRLEAVVGISGQDLSARYCEAVRWAGSIFEDDSRAAA